MTNALPPDQAAADNSPSERAPFRRALATWHGTFGPWGRYVPPIQPPPIDGEPVDTAGLR